MEGEAAQRDLLSSGFQDFMNEAVTPGLSLMGDNLPESADVLMSMKEDSSQSESGNATRKPAQRSTEGFA